jgi:ATP-dependent RNA helicase RhlE
MPWAGLLRSDFSMSFETLGLTPELLRAVTAQGYTEPTPVQAESIPFVLAGRDLLAGAQTGTGKTAAFVLPILQILNASRPQPRGLQPGQLRVRGATGLPIRCLVLTPTRELALQIEESVRTYGSERPIRSTTIYGGVGFDPQVRALRAGPEIVVATPGRLLDHAGQRTIDLSSVEILVLDEADRMLDMGFIRDIRRILELIPTKRQNLLFSATFSDEIAELAGEFLTDPAQVQIARRNAPIELVRQVVYPVDRERKRELLRHLIAEGRIDKALVFTRTKHAANRLAEQLAGDGVAAAAIHGNKSQGQRVRALDDFKAGRVSILVATEVAARGLDIEALPHVVNFELPMVPSDYVHRIGRTGRAGMEGDAVSLVCVDEMGLLREIEISLRGPIPRETIPGFEVDRSIRPEPIRQRSMGGGRPMGGGRTMGRPAGTRPMSRPMNGRPMSPRPMGPTPTMAGESIAQRPVDTRPADARPTAPRPGESRPFAPAARTASTTPPRPTSVPPMPARPFTPRPAAQPPMAARPYTSRPRVARPEGPYESGSGYAATQRPGSYQPSSTRADGRDGRIEYAPRPGNFVRPSSSGRPGPGGRPVAAPHRNPARPGNGRPAAAPGTGFGWTPAAQNRVHDHRNGGRPNSQASRPGERMARRDERA